MKEARSASASIIFPKALILVWLALSLLLWLRDRSIPGPFIFHDEALYFNLGWSIFTEGHYAGHTSYNPLYPLVIAPLFSLPSAIHTYEGIRILNCLLWSSVVFPIFLLARRFLKEQRASYLLALAAALTPLNAVVSLVWAEPLFYPLYAFCVLIFVKVLETKSLRWAGTLGLACALLFLTKQAGLALAFSILVSLLLHYYWKARGDGTFFRCIMLYAVTLALASAPWLIRNRMTAGAGVLGYSQWTDLMKQTVLTPRMLGAIGYNVSYIITAMFCVYLVYFVYGLTVRLEQPIYATFAAFTLIVSLVVLIFASLISTVVPEYAKYPIFYPVGRYLSLVFPYVFIVGAVGMQQTDNQLRKYLTQSVLICGVCCVILFLCTPLKAVGAKSFMDNPSLSVFAYLLGDQTTSFWIMPRPVTVFEQACIALLPCAALLAFLLLRKSWQPLAVLLVLIAGSSMVAARFVSLLSLAQAGNNELAKMFVRNRISASEVIFDPALNPQVSPFPFWFKNGIFSLHTLKTAPPSEFRFPAVFDFGTKDSPVAAGAIAVQAPWVGASLYNEDQGYGFDPENIHHLLSHVSPTAKSTPNGLEDHIYGNQPSRFRIKAGSGQFRLTFWVTTAGNSAPIDFDWEVNGANRRVTRQAAAQGAQFQLEGVQPTGEFIDVLFRPKPGGNWAVSKLQIEPERGPLRTDGAQYYASMQKLSLPITLKTEHVFLYKLPQGGGKAANPQSASARAPNEPQDKPLTKFMQELNSPIKQLTLKRASRTELPVTITNTGAEAWGLGGKYPIVLSYVWLRDSRLLPIEGERTARTKILKSGGSETLRAIIVAPPEGERLVLRLSMVQEGITWFFSAGGRPLDIPVVLE